MVENRKRTPITTELLHSHQLFERLILVRVEASISKPLNGLQGSFRPNIGCNMTSTMVRECKGKR